MSEPTTSPPDNPDQTDDFDPTNRAWQRLHVAVEEHLDVITWRREDGRPVLLSLVDLRSGDVVTLAVIDSLQMRDPHALLILTADSTTSRPVLSAYGPFDGATAADNAAPRLALEDPNRLGGATVPLVHPDQPTVPDTAWIDMPADLATVDVDPGPEDATPLAVVATGPHQRAARVRWALPAQSRGVGVGSGCAARTGARTARTRASPGPARRTAGLAAALNPATLPC